MFTMASVRRYACQTRAPSTRSGKRANVICPSRYQYITVTLENKLYNWRLLGRFAGILNSRFVLIRVMALAIHILFQPKAILRRFSLHILH